MHKIPPSLLEYDTLVSYVSHYRLRSNVPPDLSPDAAVLDDWLKEHVDWDVPQKLLERDIVGFSAWGFQNSAEHHRVAGMETMQAWLLHVGADRPWTGRIHALFYILHEYLP